MDLKDPKVQKIALVCVVFFILAYFWYSRVYTPQSNQIETKQGEYQTLITNLRNVEMVPVGTNREELLEHLKKSRFTRQLVYRANRSQIMGYIHLYQTLGKGQPLPNLENDTTTLLEIDRNVSVIDAINLLRGRHERMALVVDSVRKEKLPVGIVTISDLIEELTGEFNI